MRSSVEIAMSGAEGIANNITKGSIMEFSISILSLDE
jgi:fructose-specific phosphotransferase system component IIB